MFVYDIDSPLAFEDIAQYASIAGLPHHVPWILVANKCDREREQYAVPTIVGQALAASIAAEYMETSAKTGHGMQRLITLLTATNDGRQALAEPDATMPLLPRAPRSQPRSWWTVLVGWVCACLCGRQE